MSSPKLGDYLRRPGEPRLPGIHFPGTDIPGDAWKPPLLGAPEGGNEEKDKEAEAKAAMLRPHQTHPVAGRPPVGGLNPTFATRLMALQQSVRRAGGDLYVFSGSRTKQQQMQLFNDALAKYGNEREAMKRVKLPGKSTHDPEFGLQFGIGPGALGVDLRGDIHLAQKLAPHHGLVFPQQTHPWHVEFAGLDKMKA